MGQDGVLRRKLLPWRPGRWPLRRRLAATAVCLLAAGAGVIVVAGGLATRDHQLRQAGQQLRGYAGQLARHPFQLTPFSRAVPGPPGLGDLAGSGLGALSIEVRGPGGQLVMRTGSAPPAGVALEAAGAQGPVERGQPAPVRAGHGGSYLAIAEPIRFRAHRIPYAYSAQDFALDVTSPGGTGSPGTLVVSLNLARVAQATGRLAAVMLAVSGLVVLAAGGLAAWVIRALLRPVTQLADRAEAIADGRPQAGGSRACGPRAAGPRARRTRDERTQDGRTQGGRARADRPGGRPRSRSDRAAPALAAALTWLEHDGDPARGPGPDVRQAAEEKRRDIADISRELRTPISVLGGLAEYYRNRDQLSPAGFDRLMARVAAETARIAALIEVLEGAGQHPPGPSGPGENVGRST